LELLNLLCIPLGMTLELLHLLDDILALHPLGDDFGASDDPFALDGANPGVTFYMWGNLALVLQRAEQKMKITTYGPIKNLSPILKGKGRHRGKIRKLHYLYIISSKLIHIPRPGYVVVVHIFQSVGTGS
jgi:hypothetical protein